MHYLTENEEFTILCAYCWGGGIATEEKSVPPGTLRETLHGPSVGVIPTTVDEALVVATGVDASHFQKLPGNESKR